MGGPHEKCDILFLSLIDHDFLDTKVLYPPQSSGLVFMPGSERLHEFS